MSKMPVPEWRPPAHRVRYEPIQEGPSDAWFVMQFTDDGQGNFERYETVDTYEEAARLSKQFNQEIASQGRLLPRSEIDFIDKWDRWR